MKTKAQNNVIQMSDIRENSKPGMLEWRNFIIQEFKKCSSIQQIEHNIVKHIILARAEKDTKQAAFYIMAVYDVLKAHKKVNGAHYGI